MELNAGATAHRSTWKWWVCSLLLLATMINYMDRMTLNQAAYNTAVMGRALSTIPPYALGYNPYPQIVNYGPMYTGYNPYAVP